MVASRALWIGEALCAAPELQELRDDRVWDLDKQKFHEEAIEVCDECPVRRFCYDDAVHDRMSEGIRAGVLFKARTERQHEIKSSVPEYIEVQQV